MIAIVRNVDVDPAIVVEIRGDYSQTMAKLFVDSCRHGYVFKDSVALVVKETIARRAKHTRRAVVFRGRSGVTGRTVSDRKIGVVNDHQIKPAVTIVIEERRACAPARIVSPTLFRNIDKLAAAFVEIHLVRTEIRKV